MTYSCPADDAPGADVVFSDAFPAESGRAKFAPTQPLPPDEPIDGDYSTVLITGRPLEHWHTGSMTHRSRVLDNLEPEAVASLPPVELVRLRMAPGEPTTITTRRGTITLRIRVDPLMSEGMVPCPSAMWRRRPHPDQPGAGPRWQDP